jgi:hypothetical protein
VRPAWTSLLLLVASSACGSPHSCKDDPDESSSSDTTERRESWKRLARNISLDWNRVQLESFVQEIRRPRLRLPFQDGGGAFQVGRQPTVHFDRYPLDESFDLEVVWVGENRNGLKSAEVLGILDFRSRINPELFHAVELLHRCPSALKMWDFDAVRVIRTVNALQKLGGRSRSALKAYCDLCRASSVEEQLRYGLDEFRILPVVQLLYEGRNGMPNFRIGDGGLAVPGPDSWPLFPLALERDNPFFVVTGYSSAGAPASASEHLSLGDSLRSAPLSPAVDPIQAVEELTASPRWQALLNAADPDHPRTTRAGAEQLLWLVRREALHALEPIYTPPEEEPPAGCCKDPSEVQWRRIVDEVRALGIRWDPGLQDFIRSR